VAILRSNRKKRIQQRKHKKHITLFSLFALVIVIASITYSYNSKQKTNDILGNSKKETILNDKKNHVEHSNNNQKADNTQPLIAKDATDGEQTTQELNEDNENIDKTENKDTFTEVLLSAAGDCTIGTDTNFWGDTLPVVFQKKNNDYSYFFKNVLHIFNTDDLTMVNLETTFTSATEKRDKGDAVQFHFKAPPHYVKILTEGSIEAVNIANNHIYDYNKVGFEETKKTLEEEGIDYFGEGKKWITTIKGQKFGFLGYQAWYISNEFQKKIKNDIEELKNQGCVVIINFHWGIERNLYPVEYQKDLAHFAIDNGADLIIGHHPHVIESIEQYKGKFIAYSLGNFCFGGNSNPSDKRSFILQSKFKYKNNELTSIGIKVIPCRISSVESPNDYCPTPFSGDDKTAFFNSINEISPNAGFTIDDNFFFVNVNNSNNN
jgi:poly-gamma-glutamate synthesis protein (capsule biosynthesis protein)